MKLSPLFVYQLKVWSKNILAGIGIIAGAILVFPAIAYAIKLALWLTVWTWTDLPPIVPDSYLL